MAKTKSKAAHVVTTISRRNGKVYHCHLLRRSYREDGKVKNETLANLSALPDHAVEALRRSLKGEHLASVDDLFEVQESKQHGNVQAVLTAISKLGIAKLISSEPGRMRNLVLAMIAARIINPSSKLATTRWWNTTTLARQLEVEDATEEELYAAMDWLLPKQDAIEKKLAKRHLQEGGIVLLDNSSSYFEGTKCPLGRFGYNRDKKKRKLQVNYGLVADRRGCPVSISVYPGNTEDSTVFLDRVDAIREDFTIHGFIIVGDRGMIKQKQINGLKKREGMEWITALKSPTMQDMIKRETLQLGLFDDRNLFEFEDAKYPGERFVACRSKEKAESHKKDRDKGLKSAGKKLDHIKRQVDKGRLLGKDEIGLRVGRDVPSISRKYFNIEFTDDSLQYSRNEESIKRQAFLDGLYVVRTNVPEERMSDTQAVNTYKYLPRLEDGFRSMKTMHLRIRPIFHWSENRVRAHIFLCMLAYYVQFHLQHAWKSILFFDEEARINDRTDPVSPAKRSESAEQKVLTKIRPDGEEVHSFRTLLSLLGSIVCNFCRRKSARPNEPLIEMVTKQTGTAKLALDLAAEIAM